MLPYNATSVVVALRHAAARFHNTTQGQLLLRQLSFQVPDLQLDPRPDRSLPSRTAAVGLRLSEPSSCTSLLGIRAGPGHRTLSRQLQQLQWYQTLSSAPQGTGKPPQHQARHILQCLPLNCKFLHIHARDHADFLQHLQASDHGSGSQQPSPGQGTLEAAGERMADSAILRQLASYVLPHGNPDYQWRIGAALALLVASKGLNVAVGLWLVS